MEIQQQNLKQNSINLSISTKGVHTWDIKLYFENLNESNNIINKIKEIEDSLKKEFGGQ